MNVKIKQEYKPVTVFMKLHTKEEVDSFYNMIAKIKHHTVFEKEVCEEILIALHFCMEKEDEKK